MNNYDENKVKDKKKKRIKNLIMIVIFIVFFIYAYRIGNKVISDGVYYVFDGVVVGKYQEEKWLSAGSNSKLSVSKSNKITMEELKQQRQYTIYNFDGTTRGVNSQLDEEASKANSIYVMNEEEDWGLFAVSPVGVGDLPILDESEVREEIYEKAIMDILKTDGYKNNAVNIDKVVEIDMNGDGKKESIVIARNLKDEDGNIVDVTSEEVKKKKYGIYEIIVMFEKVNADYVTKIIYKDIKGEDVINTDGSFKPEAYTNSSLYFQDLNFDEKLEVFVNVISSLSEIIVYEYNGYSFTPVMYSELI